MYMNRQYGSLIEKTLGTVEEVEVDIDDTSEGPYLWLRVQINLNKTLARGRSLEVYGEKLWIPIRYKKLPRFCFNCGKIIHGMDCHVEGDKKGLNQFGSRLRVENQRRREHFSIEYRNSTRLDKQLEFHNPTASLKPTSVNSQDSDRG